MEVNAQDLVISLPGGLRGFVDAVEAIEPGLEVSVDDAEDGVSYLINAAIFFRNTFSSSNNATR